MDKKKKIGIVCAIGSMVLVGVIIYLIAVWYPKLQTGSEIEHALKPFLEAENKTLSLDIEADFNNEQITLQTAVFMVKEEAVDYIVFEQQDFPIYIAENLLLLENGKAFLISEDMQSKVMQSENLFLQVVAAYEMFEITRTENEEEIWYEIQVTGEQVTTLLNALMPLEDEPLSGIQDLHVKLVTVKDVLDRIEVEGSAEVNGTALAVEAVVSTFQILETGEYAIPEAVKESVQTVDRDALFNLTEDLYRLLLATSRITNFDDLSGNVKLHANLGVLEMNKQVELAQLRDGLSDMENASEVKALPGFVAFLCMEGDISCVEKDGSYVYTLSLNQDSMKTIASAIVPEIINYVVELTVGTAEVIVTDGYITTTRMDIRGNLNLLISELPVEVGAEFIFE